MELVERIKLAIENNEEIEIIYHGGSNPGKARTIIPQSIFSDNKIRAIDDATNRSKVFILDKIEMHDADFEVDVSEYIKHDTHLLTVQNIDQLYADFKTKFEELGYYVDSDKKDFISLHEYFKNGKPKKYSTVELRYEKYHIISMVDENDYSVFKDVATGLKEKPWTVRASSETTRSYAKFDHAVKTFYEFAKLHAPKVQDEK